MKTYIYYDSGTTNSRIYLIRGGAVLDCAKKNVGTLNNVLSGKKDTLAFALYDMYRDILDKNGLTETDVDEIYMSGMATSKNGICETGYLPVPLDLASYCQSIHIVENDIFKRSIHLLTGLIYRSETEAAQNNDVCFHNVRGEEIELFGIMEQYPQYFKKKKTAVIMPGSHTHILFTDDERITGILSCMGGELFAAVSKHTILSASVSENPENPDSAMLDAVTKGYDAVQKYGFNRALYMVRTMDLFTDASQGQRDFFLEGTVSAGIITCLLNSEHMNGLEQICVAGKPVYYDIFSCLLKHLKIQLPCSFIKQETESFALRGFLELIKEKEGNGRERSGY